MVEGDPRLAGSGLPLRNDKVEGMVKIRYAVVVRAVVLWMCGWQVVGEAQEATTHPDLRQFFLTTAIADEEAEEGLDAIREAWDDGYAGMVWDLLRFMRPPSLVQPPSFRALDGVPVRGADFITRRREFDHQTTTVFRRLIRLLEEQVGERFGNDRRRWQEWIWQQPYEPHPEYMRFKGLWYGQIDPRFTDFFPAYATSRIRLDEIDWGGALPNGTPPLEYPPVIQAGQAAYLDDDDVVFGITVGRRARAYPKRILAWHEMAIDEIGGVNLTIVYCTLCGTVIPYESVTGNRYFRFGTSGLVYRSNRLMFDFETKSLWSTLEGVPVVGDLVGRGLQLTRRAIVTTTWGEWRRRHPRTTVLSLETGHDRDYSEGVAYRDYFASDELMFGVPVHDERLERKAEVVVMLLDDPAGGNRYPVALSVEFLSENPIFHAEVAGLPFVVVTSPDGANRVYGTDGRRFVRWLDDNLVADDEGQLWSVGEYALSIEDDPSTSLARLPSQRAFWFGWYAQFSDTRLFQ